MQLHLSNKDNLDETIFLKDLSKRYILIPKLHSTVSDNEINIKMPDIKSDPILDDNNDWKSKYHILTQLNKTENKVLRKVNHSPKTNDIPTKYENTQKYETNFNNNINEDDNMKYKYEIPEKDVTVNKDTIDLLNTENNDIINDSYQKIQTTNDLNPSYEPTHFETYESNISNKIQNLYLSGNLLSDDKLNTKNYDGVVENVNPTTNSEYISLNSETEIYYEQKNQENCENLNVSEPEFQKSEKISNLDHNVSFVERNENNLSGTNTSYFTKNAPDNVVQEIEKEVMPDTTNEFPIETINMQNFTLNENTTSEDGVNINHEDISLNQVPIDVTNHVNTNSDPVIIQEHTDNTVYTTDIEEFDKEQREMFYSEQHEAFDPNTDNIYEGSEYNKKENLQQDEYNYYQGQVEQADSVEINEHEETAQRYDPSYEEQYAYRDQVYDQQIETQKQLEYRQQQYEENYVQENNYDELQQEYNQIQYEDYQPEIQIEEQFDKEQGHVEKHNEETIEIVKPVQMMQSEQEADTEKS